MERSDTIILHFDFSIFNFLSCPRKKNIHLSKLAPPPAELPVYQQADPRDVSFIGRTTFDAPGEARQFIFGIRRKDRKRHIYIIGKTGMGKTKLFELLMRQDISYGHGMILIDPDGKMISNMLDFIPEDRIQDVVVMDLADIAWPFSFNPFSGIPQHARYQTALGILEIMSRQFGATWSHRIEHVLRQAVLALLDFPEATLQSIIFLLKDSSYRKRVVSFIGDDSVKRFFESEFESFAAQFEHDAIAPIVHHIEKILAVPAARNIFTQKENKINIEDIIARRGIVLVNLARSIIGEEPANFFGSLILNALRQAGVARQEFSDENRKDFYCYFYEFHSYMRGSFINLFSESRKYGFALSVAHQYTAQIEPSALSSVLANVGTMAMFRVAGEDALRLESEMAPIFKAKDMINLAAREFYIKEMIDGEVYDPFSAETLAVLAPPTASRRQEVIDMSRKNYAMPLHNVKELFYAV